MVVMFNHGPEDYAVHEGDRIAQLICEQIYYPSLEEVDVRLFYLFTLKDGCFDSF
jgi:dUTPase